ncbi:MAG: tRNA uridine-5-carboxymethylaminomethyl(34) synthesis enzyme MnmG [Deltaproteobacteria bacterium]|nr:tRNA uridine-5-carboxymethylaminomethyl(34) synthesis enzyme MnmG [Deltaproteobacteria bacterium]
MAAHDDPVALTGPWRAIVVGGGHAGCEAALCLARCGIETLLLTQNVDRIGWMSCNPSIGGIGKSHLVAEIDALGGLMAQAADAASVHSKWLNSSRGVAVRALRAQCDKLAYATAVRRAAEVAPRLSIKQADVRGLWLDGERLRGVVTTNGLGFAAEAVVLTTGTFLDAVLHTGLRKEAGGRMGDTASHGLGEQLRAVGVATLRHKTGTCPRVAGRTIDWTAVQADPGLDPPPQMSRNSPGVALPQMPCHVTWTNASTHAAIRANLDRSPMYSGVIAGTGPRYCPSIEDKVVRFAHHDKHYLFLEREGWQTDEVYVSGLSTSLPADVQVEMVRSLPGLQRAEIVRFGYAVEYDAVDARQLGRDLQLRALPGLYLAGQINGTSGYEEAAAQGLVAGLNAAARLRRQSPVLFDRAHSYLGVMVDDLVTQGAEEPYRMFTSRAEHRLELRWSNADLRLTPLGREVGAVGDGQWRRFVQRRERLDEARDRLNQIAVRPSRAEMAAIEALGCGALSTPATLAQLLCRPAVGWSQIEPWWPSDTAHGPLDDDDREELVTEARYGGYVERERRRQARTGRMELLPIPPGFDFSQVGGLSAEVVHKLALVQPETLGQAARVPGVTPAAVQALGFALRKYEQGSARPP